MDPLKAEKTIKDAKWFAIIILVLNLIVFVISLATGAITPLTIVIKCITFAILLVTIFGYVNRKTYGPICGIIVSVLIIINFDLIDILLGVLYLVENVSLLKYFNN